MRIAEIEVEFQGGVYLPDLDLWLDPHRRKPRAFVSHAHADHVAPHAESICSTDDEIAGGETLPRQRRDSWL